MSNVFFKMFAVLMLAGSVQAGRCVFTGDFAPQEGFVKQPEQPLRQELCLNGPWRFQPLPVPDGYAWDKGILPELPPPVEGKWEKVPVKIPSPWNANHWGNGPKAGAGTLAVCALDYTVQTPTRRAFWKKLFAHMGVKAQAAQAAGGQGGVKAHDLLLDGPQK